MISSTDFNKKQIAVVLFNEGEKMSFQNDNMIIKDANGKIKLQCTCYRLFLVFAIGNFTVTSVFLQKAKKFGFFIALMTSGFRMYGLLGAQKDGNTMLKRKQYDYEGLEIAQHIIVNKISNQKAVLASVRNKSDAQKEAIAVLDNYLQAIPETCTLNELMAYEGLAAKIYFKNHFNNVLWNGRKPRVKSDYVNSTLDIGYSILFTFVDAILSSYGFDTFCGVMHRQFYMRKSLVCDIVEPFRVIIDGCIKKGINLKQIKETDFMVSERQYKVKWEFAAKYSKLFMSELLCYKDEIFAYIQSFYRAFMKGIDVGNYPIFDVGG